MRTLAFAVLAIPSLVAAGPLSLGVGAGVTQSKENASYDPSHTLGVFGRIGVTSRVAGQLELGRITTSSDQVDIRSETGLLVVDLGNGGHLMPMIVAGAGFAQAHEAWGETDAHHIEGGLGLEYRAEGGLTIGADVRMGGRSIDSQPAVILACCTDLYTPETLHPGEYRSARFYAAVRF